jgi:uncharacterized protein (TIGR02246 family)
MRVLLAFIVVVLAAPVGAQSATDSAAIREIVTNEIAAWNQGDAAAYSRHFAAEGTFTNLRGQFFVGYDAFLKQHDAIFKTLFRGTTLEQEIVSLKFVTNDVAVVEVLTAVSGMKQPPPGAAWDARGRLRTRLLQVVARQQGGWKIVAYHNVDVKAGVPLPGSV